MKNTIINHNSFKSLTLGILGITLAFCASNALAFSNDITQALEDNIEFKTQVEDQSMYWNDNLKTSPAQITLSQLNVTNSTDVKES